MNDNERIAEWAGWKRVPQKGMMFAHWIDNNNETRLLDEFDKYLFLWHGDDGLLKEIHNRRVDYWFCNALRFIVDPSLITTSPTGLIEATPAQLSAALVKTIEEEETCVK